MLAQPLEEEIKNLCERLQADIVDVIANVLITHGALAFDDEWVFNDALEVVYPGNPLCAIFDLARRWEVEIHELRRTAQNHGNEKAAVAMIKLANRLDEVKKTPSAETIKIALEHRDLLRRRTALLGCADTSLRAMAYLQGAVKNINHQLTVG